MDLKPLFEKHKRNHPGQDIFALVMAAIGGVGLGIAIASYLYVKSKYARFTDTKLNGVRAITTSMAPTDELEVNRHYVVIPGGTNTVNIYLNFGTNYAVDSYLSFYQAFPLCGEANAAVVIGTGPKTLIHLNVPEESATLTYDLYNNSGALFIVDDDLGIRKWKLVRLWSLDLSNTGQTFLLDTQSFTKDGANARRPKTS
jgi:hypothetical protein